MSHLYIYIYASYEMLRGPVYNKELLIDIKYTKIDRIYNN